MDLLALLKFTATLSVWLAHCQKMTDRSDGLGMSIPAHILKVRASAVPFSLALLVIRSWLIRGAQERSSHQVCRHESRHSEW